MKSKIFAAVLLSSVIFSSIIPSSVSTVYAEQIKSYPESVNWFTATYAINTVRNDLDLFVPGGGDPEEAFYSDLIKIVLSRDWGVTDRQTAQETLAWLENGGHNQALLEYYKARNLGQYTTDADLNTSWDQAGNQISDQEAVRQMAAYMAYQDYGDAAIQAWDMSRALMLLGQYYVAGYYTYEEAMDQSLVIAQRLQATYPSWDDFAQSYIYGYAYWSKSDPTDPYGEFLYRVSIYQDLKAMEGGPYQLDWHMELRKEW